MNTQFMRNYVLFYGALFLLVVLLQPAHGKTPVTAPSSSFWDTGMRLCDVDANGNCHDANYARSVARFGGGGAAAALLSFLAFVVFIPGRFCCNGFGGKNPSYGVCCGDKEEREYSRNEVLAVKIAVFIVAIPIIIGIAIGYESNSGITSSVNNITTSVEGSGDNILSSIISARDILIQLPITSGDNATINGAIDTATSLNNHLHNAHDNVNKYDKIRNTIMIVAFAFSLSLVAVGLICVIFNMRSPAIIIGLIAMLVMTIVWVSFGIHMVADKFVYDVCVDIKLLQTNSSNSTSILKTGALANLWDCGTNSQFSDLQNLVQNAMDTAANQACSARTHVCDDLPGWHCVSTPACAASTLTTVTDPQHMQVTDAGLVLSVQQCAVSCVDSTNKNVSISIVDVVNQYTNFTQVYNSTVLPLISCQFANEVIQEFQGPLCSTLFDSMWGVAVSNLIVGIFYVAFVILMIVGFKRFTSSTSTQIY